LRKIAKGGKIDNPAPQTRSRERWKGKGQTVSER